jgi:hypothetical protein
VGAGEGVDLFQGWILLQHWKMGRKPTKTPQQKKALSLKRDRRNTYGNNQKAARKAIPLRKALENRRNRHKNNHAVAQIDPVNEPKLDLVESSARQDIHRIGGWKKSADEPLGVIIVRSKAARLIRVGGKKFRARFDYSKSS